MDSTYVCISYHPCANVDVQTPRMRAHAAKVCMCNTCKYSTGILHNSHTTTIMHTQTLQARTPAILEAQNSLTFWVEATKIFSFVIDTLKVNEKFCLGSN